MATSRMSWKCHRSVVAHRVRLLLEHRGLHGGVGGSTICGRRLVHVAAPGGCKRVRTPDLRRRLLLLLVVALLPAGRLRLVRRRSLLTVAAAPVLLRGRGTVLRRVIPRSLRLRRRWSVCWSNRTAPVLSGSRSPRAPAARCARAPPWHPPHSRTPRPSCTSRTRRSHWGSQTRPLCIHSGCRRRRR